MTLLELLVKKLPEMGGWPEDYNSIEMHNDGGVFFDGRRAVLKIPQCSDGWRKYSDKYTYNTHSASGFWSNAVTREQYEAALAAAQQPVWDGEGLPPVGVECEVKGTFGDESFYGCKILAHTTFSGHKCAVFQTNDTVSACSERYFRPIQSEAERKREETIKAITDLAITCDNHNDYQFSVELYDAIAAGKIPGVELSK